MKTRFYRCCIATILFLGCTLNLHAQGTLWGALSGGSSGKGVIVNTNADNTSSNSVAHNFDYDIPGSYPNYGSLLLAPNGKFYGLTSTGGMNGYGNGVLFEYTPATNTYVDKFDFDITNGKNPDGSLIVFNGKLYGMTTLGGANNLGVIFEYDLIANTVTAKYNFTTAGNTPHGSLTVANNKLYGMTAKGGTGGGGTIFSYDPSTNTFVTHVNLSAATTGSSPYGSLTLANGKLYGMTKNGGSGSFGVVFEMDITATPHTYTVKQTFTGTTGITPGANPYGDLTFVNNKLYGLTYTGGTSDAGVFFEYDVAGTGTYTVLKNMDATIGYNPNGSPFLASNGKLYGTTRNGTISGLGVIFEYDFAGTYTQKNFATFGQSQGSLAEANGSLFGLTTYGGIANAGVLFEYVISSKNLTKKIDFNTVLSGYDPGQYGGLELDPLNGMLYGTTRAGGINDNGVLFQFDPATFTYSKKYDFNNVSGYQPQAKLTWVGGAVNKFYGTTDSGGANNAGTIFEYDPGNNIYTKKVDLQSSSGATIKGLTLASNGKLYGLGSGSGLGVGSGAYTWGALIEYTPGATTYSDKYDFTNTPNGANGVSPSGSLVEMNGFLYGTTGAGGSNLSAGVIFRYDFNTGGYAKLHNLVAATGGGGSSLTAVNGKLYGTTFSGGAYPLGGGTIFSYDPTADLLIDLHDFDTNAGGESFSYGTLTAVNNKLYGVTKNGGSSGKGALFEYDIATSTYTKKFDFTGPNGDQPYANSLLFIPGKLSQGITFNSIPAKNIGDAAFSLNVTGGASGQTVTYLSSNPSVATVSATGTVTIISAGSTDITASQTGNATYNASADVKRTLVVKPLPPSVNTTGTLTAFSTAVGTPSAAKNFTASGANLIANLVITPPAQFEVSLSSGSGFAATVSIVPTSGTVAVTTIYIRYNPTAAGSSSGNIAVASFGASTKNIAVNGTANILVSGITVSGAGNATTITTNTGILQMNAEVLPFNATNQNVTWSISNGSAATISTLGLLTAVANGTVTVKALANDGSTVSGTKDITISGQNILVTGITVTGASNATTITTNAGTLQMNAEVLPSNATNSNITWSITNGPANATISASGLLTAIANGTITVKATANDGSTKNGTKDITISGQTVLATGITITGASNATTITTNAGTLQMNAEVLPNNATNQNVTWSISNGTANATISASGLLTAMANGTVTVKADANDGSGINGTKDIIISGQASTVLVAGIIITGAGNVSVINIAGGTLQINAAVSPAGATNQTITWTVVSNSGSATISSTGLLTALGNGTVTVKATANDGSGVNGTLSITISGQNQNTFVSDITVTGAGNVSAISLAGGTLQMNAAVVPANATNPAVIWSVSNGSAAIISSSGLLTATGNGVVTVKASANDGSGISGTKNITISGQTAMTTKIISLSGTLAFGDNIVGVDHPTKNFTITNNGTGTLIISAITVPAEFAVDKTSGAISAGQSMTVSLTFTPTAAVDYNGTITVISDATSGGNTLAVTAKGVLITALGDQSTVEGIEVYPNPSKGVFILRMNDGNESASITSINGVTHYVKLQTIEKNLYKLDLTDKADGLYILKCKSGKSVVAVRLVKAQ